MDHLLRDSENYLRKKERLGSKKLNEYQRKSYHKHKDEVNARNRERYKTSPEFKKTLRECGKRWIENNRDKFNETQKKYRQTERGKEIIKTSLRKYQQSEKGKKRLKEYQQSERFKEWQKKYYQLETTKEKMRKYQKSENGIKSRKKYLHSEKGKITFKKITHRRRGLGFNILYDNIFEDEDTHWHHINDNDVVAIPREIHQLYYTRNIYNHRENLKPIIEQLYGWIP